MISGNTVHGVEISDAGTTDDTVLGNRIGTNAAGTGPLGNHGSGVVIEAGATGNTVGGTAAGSGNTIMFNGTGVSVDAGAGATGGDSIEGNSIDSNDGLGIRLLSGANNSEPAAGITGVTTAGTTTHITATLHAPKSTTFRIEFFASPSCDPSGSGEGRQLLAAVDVTTSNTGSAPFFVDVPALPPGQAVTDTATSHATGDTSQFSACAISP